jgi:hypothetical protein
MESLLAKEGRCWPDCTYSGLESEQRESDAAFVLLSTVSIPKTTSIHRRCIVISHSGNQWHVPLALALVFTIICKQRVIAQHYFQGINRANIRIKVHGSPNSPRCLV